MDRGLVIASGVIAFLFVMPLWHFGELGATRFSEPVSNLVWDEGMQLQQDEEEYVGSSSGGSGPSGPSSGSSNEAPANSNSGESNQNRTNDDDSEAGSGSGSSGGSASSGGSGPGSSPSAGVGSGPQIDSSSNGNTPAFDSNKGTGGGAASWQNLGAGLVSSLVLIAIYLAAARNVFLTAIMAFVKLGFGIGLVAFTIVAGLFWVFFGVWAGIGIGLLVGGGFAIYALATG